MRSHALSSTHPCPQVSNHSPAQVQELARLRTQGPGVEVNQVKFDVFRPGYHPRIPG